MRNKLIVMVALVGGLLALDLNYARSKPVPPASPVVAPVAELGPFCPPFCSKGSR